MTNNITSTARLAPPVGGIQKRVRMPRVVAALAATLLAGAATSGVANADSVAVSKARPELQEAMQAFVDVGFAGMQLRVHDERGEWVGSTGVRKLGENAKPSTNGRFRIGSNTKTFVATVVLRLVAERKIGLDASVNDYLPRFGLDRRITVRMLLQHTSGVFNHTGDYYDGTAMPGLPSTGKEWVDNRFHTYQPDELVRFALSKPPLFAPGTDWNYSNTNYTLAGLLIEKVTGRSYAEETQRRILRPLGLWGTVVPGAWPGIPGPHAHGYYRYQDAGQPKTADAEQFATSLTDVERRLTERIADLIARRDTLRQLADGDRLLLPGSALAILDRLTDLGFDPDGASRYGLINHHREEQAPTALARLNALVEAKLRSAGVPIPYQ